MSPNGKKQRMGFFGEGQVDLFSFILFNHRGFKLTLNGIYCLKNLHPDF